MRPAVMPPPNGASSGARASAVDWSERVAVCASAACLLHCLALPLVFAALPAVGTVLKVPEAFHLWMLGFACPAAALALGAGWRRHRSHGPPLAGTAGLALLAAGALLFDSTPWEVAATVAGGLLLAGAHLVNWRLRHACACC